MINEQSSPEAKERYARFWGQLPVLPEQRAAQIAAQRAANFSTEPPRTLGDYDAAPKPSKFDRQPSDSDFGYVRRLQGVGLQNLGEQLAPDVLQRVSTAYNEAITRLEGGVQTHDQLRESLDSRNSGSNVGLYGREDSPQQRATALGSRFDGEQQVEKMGHLAASASQPLNLGGTGAQHPTVSLWDRLARPKQIRVQRPVIPSGSSGTDWVGVDRG